MSSTKNGDNNYLLEYLRSAAGNTFILFLGDFLYNLVLAIGSIFIARILGSEGYGAFSLALVPPLTLVSLLSLGIDTAATRYIQKFLAEENKSKAIYVVRSSLLMRSIINIVGAVACFVFSSQLAQILVNRAELGEYVRVASAIVFLQGVYSLVLSIFIGVNMAVGVSIAKITYSVSKTLVSIVMLMVFNMGVLGALIGNIIGYVIALVIALIFLAVLLRRFHKYSSNADGMKNVLWELLSYGIPLYASSIVSIAVSIYQNLLIAYALPLSDIGGYRAISNFNVLITVVASPISASLLPLFTHVFTKFQDMENMLKLSNKYTSFVLVPVTMIAMIFSRELIYIFYGSQYLFAYHYLPLLLAPNLLVGLGSLTIPVLLNAVGDTKANMKASIVSSIALVATSYLLTMVLKLGLWGYLTSLLISSAVGMLLVLAYARRYVRNPIDINQSIKIYLASTMAAAATIPIFHISVPRFVSAFRIAAGFTLFVLIYVAASVYFNIIREDDVEFIVKAFNRFPIVNIVINLLAKYALTLINLMGSDKKTQ